MYFKDSQLIFLHPTKTGGSMIEHYLMRTLRDSITPDALSTLQYLNKDGYDEHHDIKRQVMFGNYRDDLVQISLQHACILTASRLLGEAVFDASRKIAIVRNPYTRLVSQFFYYGFDKASTFSGFVQDTLPKYASTASKLALNFAARQTLYTHRNGVPAVDVMLRQERMEASVGDLSRFLGLPIHYDDAKRIRKSRASLAYENYMDAYDERSLEIVGALYADDFELLGYDT